MTWLSPGARRLIARWGETVLYGALTAFGLWAFLFEAGLSDPWRWGLAAFVLAAGLLLARSAALSALGRGAARAPGIVSVAERRVAYFGPHQGSLVSLDEIRRIEIWAPDPAHWRDEAEWVLRHEPGEPALVVPVSAEGAGELVDAFAALPGFRPERALAALRAPEGATVAIWERAAPPRLAPTSVSPPAPPPALARRAGPD